MECAVRIIQISDTHIAAAPNKTLLGVNLRESFSAVVELVKQNEFGKIDSILLSGDLSHDGSLASYYYVADALKPMQVPVYAVPGNHDNGDVMQQAYPYTPILKHIIKDGWQFILLDSLLPGQVKGLLAESELDYLEQCLQNHPNERAVIVFHHHPVSVGCAWLENIGLSNAAAFWEIVKRYPNVHTILFGHVHMEFHQVVNGVPVYSVPSTCIQFKREQAQFGLDNIPPGYRWLEFKSDGQVDTGVIRCDHYVGVFDVDAKGY